MPELSRFFGIVIHMYYREHGPSHFHAIYGEYEAVIDIGSGQVITDAVLFGAQAVKRSAAPTRGFFASGGRQVQRVVSQPHELLRIQ